MSRVIAVIVNWNGREETLACLASLAASRRPPEQTIVVDNGSADGSVAAIKGAFPAVDVLALPRNHNFAGGANRGLRRALALGADYVWLLNNDVTVAEDALQQLLAAAEGANAGIAGPRVRTPPADDELGAWWDFERGRILPAYAGRQAEAQGIVDVDYVWGCAMLLRSDLLRRVGLLDERYVAYFEDADLCRRAQVAGYRVVATTEALVWHAGSHSADRRPLWQTWRRAVGRLRFYWTHAGRRQRPGLVAWTVCREWPLLLAGMVGRFGVRTRARTGARTRGRVSTDASNPNGGKG